MLGQREKHRCSENARARVWVPEKVMLELSLKDEQNYPGKGHSD